MSTPDHPPPVHAAMIWTNGDKIFLTFPGHKGTEDRPFNTVTLDPPKKLKCEKCGKMHDPQSDYQVMFSILRERANATHAHQRTIGQKATPTQHQVDEWLRTMKPTRIEPKKDISNVDTVDILKSIGL